MSHFSVTWLECDAKNCQELYEGDPGETIAQIRVSALRYGWSSSGRRDFCPDCRRP